MRKVRKKGQKGLKGKTSKNSSTCKTSNTDVDMNSYSDRQTDKQTDTHFTYAYDYLKACTTATRRMITLETTLLVVLTGKMKA